MREAFEGSKTGYTLGSTLDANFARGIQGIQHKTTPRGFWLRYREGYQLSDGR